MEQSDVQQLFARFAAPLASFVTLGGRKESVEQLARNLWMAMLAGDQAEQQVWRSLARTNSELSETVKNCYLQQMKPQVGKNELEALRKRYWPGDHSENPGTDRSKPA